MRQRLRSVKLCWTPSDMPVLNYAECPELPPHKRSMLWVCSWMIYEIKEWPTCLSLWEVSSLQHCQPQPHNKPNLNITQINPSSSLALLQALLRLVLTSQPWHGLLFFIYPCSYFKILWCSPLKVEIPWKWFFFWTRSDLLSVSAVSMLQVAEQMAFACPQNHLPCIHTLGVNMVFMKKIFYFFIQYLITAE